MPARPDRLFLRIRRLTLGFAGVLVAGGVAVAGPTDTAALEAGIARLSDLVVQSRGQVRPAPDLLAGSGLAAVLAPSAPAGPAAAPRDSTAPEVAVEAQAMDLRLALSLMVQVAGPTDSRAVQTAQGPGDAMRALVIRKGIATLADLDRLLAQFDLQPPRGAGDLVLAVPLVIWEGAALRLSEGETLGLSRPDGAFVVNFGHLAMTGAAIYTLGAPNPHLPRFAPFVATVGSGSFQIDASRFSGLGFGRTRPFAGFSLLHNTLMPEQARSYIRDSLFEGLVSVVIGAASDVTIAGNRFDGARGEGLILAASPRASVTSNIFVGQAEFNAVQIVEGSGDAVVSGNVVLGGAKSGIVVRSASHRAYVANNIIWQRTGGGITVERSDCANIRANIVIANSQKGIEVRSSDGSLVQGNHVSANRSAGIWISAQTPQAQTFVMDNVLLANRAGLATATGGGVMLRGNDFRGQFPRFLAGDLARQSPFIAGNLTGAQPLLLTSGGALPVADGLADCARY